MHTNQIVSNNKARTWAYLAFFEFSLNVFNEFSELSDKDTCHYSKLLLLLLC